MRSTTRTIRCIAEPRRSVESRSPHASRQGAPAVRRPAPKTDEFLSRRVLIGGTALSIVTLLQSGEGLADSSLETPLCDESCAARLDSIETVTTTSGLQFKDLIVGKGPKPPIGFQVVAHVVTMTEDGQVVDSSKERNLPYDIRVGAGQAVAGLDEGLSTMRVGSTRRLYVPGSLGFKKNLKAAPGRPRIEANTPLVIDVQLLYIPGLETEEGE